MLDDLRRDLAYGTRLLLRQPRFTVAAILTLALGIGATTAIFVIVNAVLFRPLPFPQSERLMFVGQSFQGGVPISSGEPKFLFWSQHQQSFDALACYSSFGGAQGNVTGGKEAEYVRGLRISAGFFAVFGVSPAIGRAFTKAEDTPGSEQVAILSDGLWRRQFGAQSDIVGTTLSFNDQPVAVVGIMPPDFRFDDEVDLFIPMRAKPGSNVDPNAEVVGRLKTGVTLEHARSEMNLIAEQFRTAFPQQMRDGEGIAVRPYHEMLANPLKKYLWMLIGAVTFFLLIACANVANLQLARAASRQREFAVRRALGAGEGRIRRQLLTEGMLLALIGGIAGTMLAIWGKDVLLAGLPGNLMPRLMSEATVDWRVLLCALSATAVTGLVFGLAPAWQARRVEVYGTLKESGSRVAGGRGRLGSALVVAEIALSLVLLVGAGLLGRTFLSLMSVEPGFDPRQVLIFQLVLDGPRYSTTAKASALYDQTLDRIRSIPGVESAAVINKLPLDWQFNMPVTLAHQPDNVQSMQVRMVSPDYFRAMRIGVARGRSFNSGDNAAGTPVAVVNEAFVRKYVQGSDPFTAQLTIGRGTNDLPRQIVGVIADVKQMGLDRPVLPTVFAPIPQLSDRLLSIFRSFTPAYFTIRTTTLPRTLIEPIRNEISRVDPGLAMSQIATMEEITARSVSQQRFYMILLGLFASLGLVLASIGVYGVMSYSVAQRHQELGIRIALGANHRDVIRLIVRDGLALAAIGVGIGAIASFALTRLIKGFLFGISPTDPMTFVGVACLLLSVALLACWIPARRATLVDPLIALRAD